MGDVYRAQRIGSDEVVAVKVLRGDFAEDPEVIARFLQERAVLVSLNDERLVRVHDLVVEGGLAAIVMDLLDGGDLRQYMASRPDRDPVDAARMVIDVLGALEIVHAAGVLHRDVKPENILLDARSRPHLADFGISKLLERPGITQMTGMIGTPTYMAPEIGLGQHITGACDVYAAGVMLFELVVGTPPFVAPNFMSLLRLHTDATVVFPADFPTSLRPIVGAMLSKDPAERPTAGEAAALLEAWVLTAGPIALVGETQATDVPPVSNSTVVSTRAESSTIIRPMAPPPPPPENSTVIKPRSLGDGGNAEAPSGETTVRSPMPGATVPITPVVAATVAHGAGETIISSRGKSAAEPTVVLSRQPAGDGAHLDDGGQGERAGTHSSEAALINGPTKDASRSRRKIVAGLLIGGLAVGAVGVVGFSGGGGTAVTPTSPTTQTTTPHGGSNPTPNPKTGKTPNPKTGMNTTTTSTTTTSTTTTSTTTTSTTTTSTTTPPNHFTLTGLTAPSAIPHSGAQISLSATFTGSLPAGDKFKYTMNENWSSGVQSSGPTSLATATFQVDPAPVDPRAQVTFTVEVINQSGTVLQSKTATASIA